jgi:hypothetical protein
MQQNDSGGISTVGAVVANRKRHTITRCYRALDAVITGCPRGSH